MSEICSAFGVPDHDIPAPSTSTKDGINSLHTIQHYYDNEMWHSRLTRQTVELINDRCDWGIAQSFGYSKMDTQDFPRELLAETRIQFAREMMKLELKTVYSEREAGATTAA